MLEENRDLISKYEDVVLSMNSESRRNTDSQKDQMRDQSFEQLRCELLMVKNQLREGHEELNKYRNQNKKLIEASNESNNDSFLLSSCKKNVLATIRETKNENIATSVPFNREEQNYLTYDYNVSSRKDSN